MQRKIRVLVAKPGLDGHDRGAKVVAAALRDAGMEVIYTGLHQTPEQIVEAAVQEDVDVVALSILSGAHMTLFPEVLALMKERGIGDRLLSGGGIVPAEDMEALAKLGVGRLFGPGASTQDIAAYIREWFVAEHGEEGLAPAPKPKADAATRAMPTAAERAHHTPAVARADLTLRAAPAAKPTPSAKPARAGTSRHAVAKRVARRAATRAAKPARAERRAGREATRGAKPRRTAKRSSRARR
jgi:methylmalonyl-CoA mutase C-terminal domain/subunit